MLALVGTLTFGLTFQPLAFSGAAPLPDENWQAPSTQSSDEFVSAAAGFKISKPLTSWALNTQPGDHGISTLAMGPPEHAGKVQFSISISAATSQDLEALQRHRDSTLAQIEAVPEIRDGKSIEVEIAGLKVPGLRVVQDALGSTFEVHQAFFISQGLQYTFQFHAPRKDFSKYQPLFKKALRSFEIVELDSASQEKAKLHALAARCGSEVHIHKDWKSASKAARKKRQLIVVAIQAIPGFEIGDQIARGPFMDQDIVQLLKHRFVVLRWHKGMGAPFESQDSFGMGPSTFGTGLLLVTPAGDVVRQVFLLQSTAVYDVLIDALKGHPKLDAPRPATGSSHLQKIDFLLQSGQLADAEILLKEIKELDEDHANAEMDPVYSAWLQAEFHRLQRHGGLALEEIGRALSMLDANPTHTSIHRNRLLLTQSFLLGLTGSAQSAEAAVDRLLVDENQMASALLAEARFWKGILRLQAKDDEATESVWMKLINHHPESPWAWLAAAAITGPGWGMKIYPDLQWPEEQHRRLGNLPVAAEAASKAMPVTEMIGTAADYLLSSQQQDGSWISMTAYGNRKVLADDFDIAATVIGGRALLRLKDHPDAQTAAKRALQWLLDQRKLLQQQDKPPVVFMDYAVWSRSYCIYFLADCLQAEVGDADLVRQEMQNCLQDLAERQQPNGGWSYYLSGAAGGAAIPQAISFTSATVVLALERAKEVGADVDANMLERGLKCMQALRSPEGTFGYFLHGPDVETGTLSGTGPEASAARGPVCALSLMRGNKESVAELIPRLELYVKHLPGFGKQRRKALMHAGLHTQGSHYLLYDYSMAAEALLEAGKDGIPKKLRKQVYAAVLRELRACGNQDGSYVDNPLIGVDIGTGLALSGLLDLQASGVK